MPLRVFPPEVREAASRLLNKKVTKTQQKHVQLELFILRIMRLEND